MFFDLVAAFSYGLALQASYGLLAARGSPTNLSRKQYRRTHEPFTRNVGIDT